MKLFKFFTFSLVLSMSIIFSSCGIDNFVYLYPVTQVINYPSTVDEALNYFEFRTSDKNNHDASGDYFKGYELYYRIYNSVSALNSDVSAIYSYNDDNPTTSFNYLVNTKKYTRLVYEGRETDVPLIPGSTSNRDVKIRLTRFGEEYPAGFSIDSSGNLGNPLRSLDEGTSFSLFDYDDIETDDDDVLFTSSGDDEWLVQLYVVAYGYDESYKSYYSEVFSLQYVTIYDDE